MASPDDPGSQPDRSPTTRATASVVCGVLACLTFLAAAVAIPLGVVAVWLGLSYRTDPQPRPGDGRALAGALTGAIGGGFAIITLAYLLFGSGPRG